MVKRLGGLIVGRLIFKQPNGLYGRWSGIVDAFTHWNMTKKDVIKYEKKEHQYRVTELDFIYYYDKYDLDYIIKNHGYSLIRRAILEGNLRDDVYQVMIDMGCTKEQQDYMIDVEKEVREDLSHEEIE